MQDGYRDRVRFDKALILVLLKGNLPSRNNAWNQVYRVHFLVSLHHEYCIDRFSYTMLKSTALTD